MKCFSKGDLQQNYDCFRCLFYAKYFYIFKIVLKFHIHVISDKSFMAHYNSKNVPSISLFA